MKEAKVRVVLELFITIDELDLFVDKAPTFEEGVRRHIKWIQEKSICS